MEFDEPRGIKKKKFSLRSLLEHMTSWGFIDCLVITIFWSKFWVRSIQVPELLDHIPY